VEFELKIKLNDKLYLKDPMESELGRLIIKEALPLLNELGFEDFTFKKLAFAMCGGDLSEPTLVSEQYPFKSLFRQIP
jgi:hypothetical protein